MVFSGYVESILPLLTEASIVFIEDDTTETNVTVMKAPATRLYDFSGRMIFRVNASLKQVD